MEPFIGSSILLSPYTMKISSSRSSEVYSLTTFPSTKTSERLLKQYYKKDAKRLWSFHSTRFHENGLFPINPLRVRDHPIVSNDSLLECASLLLRTFVYQERDRSKISDLLNKVKNDEKLKRKLKLSADGYDTFSELMSLINNKGGHTVIFSTLSELENKEDADFFKDDSKTTRKLKQTVLDVGKSGFFSKIKRLNQKNIPKNINKQHFVLSTKKPTLILSF